MTDIAAAWKDHLAEGAPLYSEFEYRSVQSYLDEAAAKYGSRKAVTFQNLTYTYKQLKDKAEAFAASLREHGLQTGDRVAIMMPNIPQTIIAFWGAMKAGAVVVMTNPLYMEKELTHHFSDSSPKFLIMLDLFWNKIQPLRDRLNVGTYVVSRIADGLAFPLNLLQPLQAKRQHNYPHVDFDDKTVITWKSMIKTRKRYTEECADPKNTVALLQYTGGTTGFSKGAMLSHSNLTCQLQQLIKLLQHDASRGAHCFLSILPFFHVLGLVGNVILPCAYAASTIPVPRYSPHDVLELIKKHRPSFFVGAPSVYISLMQQKDVANYDLTCIQYCISGSSPFPQAAMKQFQDMTHAKITEGFGLTEASPCVTANPLYKTQKIGSVGIPLPDTEVAIMSLEDGKTQLGDNQSGEICARGPQIMMGYWNHPEETAATLADGWLHTGDIGNRDSDGYYFIVDRKKDMAIVGGYNVFPREIDEVLHEHPKIKEAVSLSVPHKTRGEMLKAYIVVKDGAKLSTAELAKFCREKLASYKVPRVFEFRDELPKTLVGKVLRRALREEEEKKLAAELEADKATENKAE
ncbi:MAG: long-chain fatty acid--CoA ligase [Mailhella sp.]|nr:long-chain fatty acid--CoA ligase [Mailhella sp.]